MQGQEGRPLPGVLVAGDALDSAQAAMILVHGRGASAGDIMVLAGELGLPGFSYLAPQAAGNVWYPNRYADPIDSNEPWLSASLQLLERVLAHVEHAVPAERVVLLGFSQGACLTLEFAARHARRYGAVMGLSGALIGPPGMPRQYEGSLEGTPVFLGCSDVDPHIAAQDVLDSAEVLERLGAKVKVKLYAGMGHTVSQEELAEVLPLMAALTAGA